MQNRVFCSLIAAAAIAGGQPAALAQGAHGGAQGNNHQPSQDSPPVRSVPTDAATSPSNSVGTVRSGTYYEDHAMNYDCGPTFVNCFLNFATTPTDKFLTITNVDCTNLASGVPTLNALYVQPQNGYARSRALPNAPVAYGYVFGSGNGYILNFNAPINLKVGAGKTLYMNFFRSSVGTGAPFAMDCTISGTLSDPAY